MLTSVRHSLLQLDLTELGIGKVQLEPPLVRVTSRGVV
jgi:hypothetical protein